MRQNNIIKYELESRAKELRGQDKKLEDIANILSSESKKNITVSTVFRYFQSNEQAAIQVIEKKDKLKAVVAEAEISTISQRQQVINGLLGLAQNAENEHARVMAYKEANNALDSLDKRLGKFAGAINPESQTVINITQNNLTIKDKIQRYRDAGLFDVK